MSDQFSEVSSESWLGRIGSSIVGVLFGLVFVLVAIAVLCWNEKRAVTTAKSLKEGAAAVVSAEPATVDPANDKKLVHVTGDATTAEVLSDPTFGISTNALRLTRDVAMYQWKEDEKSETKNKLGGGTETVKTYTYEKTWSEKRIDSMKFKYPQDHANPGGMVADNHTVTAQKASLGAFRLTASLIGKMEGDESLAPTEEDLGKLKPALKEKAKVSEDAFYFGADSSAPAIGDQRVTFKVLKPGTFSVIAQQVGDTFAPYPTRAGDEIERVESGTLTAAAMFQHAASENAMLTWILRAVGFIFTSIGIGLVLRPITVVADVVPIIGSILGVGLGFAAIVLGFVITLITIAVVWIVVRPILGISLLVLAIAGFFLSHRAGKSRQAVAAQVAPAN
jgi:hypothetical protein